MASGAGGDHAQRERQPRAQFDQLIDGLGLAGDPSCAETACQQVAGPPPRSAGPASADTPLHGVTKLLSWFRLVTTTRQVLLAGSSGRT